MVRIVVQVEIPEAVWQAFRLVGLATNHEAEEIVANLAGDSFSALDIILCDMLPDDSPITEKLLLHQLETDGKDSYPKKITTKFIGEFATLKTE
jgi:hypothetical protein